METRSPENLLHTKGVVVYLAHPFGGSFENKILARNLARRLTKEYPEATFINPLDNVDCRIGSLENSQQREVNPPDVDCRIGSLETSSRSRHWNIGR